LNTSFSCGVCVRERESVSKKAWVMKDVEQGDRTSGVMLCSSSSELSTAKIHTFSVKWRKVSVNLVSRLSIWSADKKSQLSLPISLTRRKRGECYGHDHHIPSILAFFLTFLSPTVRASNW